MNTALFVSVADKRLRLAEIAKIVFGALQMDRYEERFSENYPNGHYFREYATNAEVVVADDDIDTGEAFPFLISFEAPVLRRGANAVVTGADAVAAPLAAAGLTVFIPIGNWYLADWDGQGRRIPAA